MSISKLAFLTGFFLACALVLWDRSYDFHACRADGHTRPYCLIQTVSR